MLYYDYCNEIPTCILHIIFNTDEHKNQALLQAQNVFLWIFIFHEIMCTSVLKIIKPYIPLHSCQFLCFYHITNI